MNDNSEKPWLDDPQYDGMSDFAAEQSWRAKQDKQRADDSRKGKAFEFRAHRDRNLSTPRFLVKNLIPETGTGLLSGQSGTYKSFVTLKLAGAVATGKPFLVDHATKRRGAVLCFLSEGGCDMALRLEALSHGEHDGHKLPIYFVEHPIALLDPLSVQDVIVTASAVNDQAMRDFKVPLVLIAFDTLIGCANFRASGDENDSVVNEKLMRVLDAISKIAQAFCIGVDHMGKTTETGTRGSSAKEASADVVLSLLANKSPSGEITSARLCVRKSRGGPAGREFPFTVKSIDLGLDEDGDALRSLIVEFGTESAPAQPNQKEPRSKGTRELRRIMMELIADCGKEIQPYSDGPTVRALPANLVRDQFYQRYGTGETDPKKKAEVRRKAFNRALADRRFSSRELDGTEWLWFAIEGGTDGTNGTHL